MLRALPLVTLLACGPSITIDPLPQETTDAALVITGSAPPLTDLEVRGAASKVLTASDKDGRFMTWVALAPDRTNTLTIGRAGVVDTSTRATIVHKSPDVSHFLDQSKSAPELRLTSDAAVKGLVATLSGLTTARATVRVSGGTNTITDAADGSGHFELQIPLLQQTESELVVVARSKSGIDSAPLAVRVTPVMTATPPPIPAIDPGVAKTTTTTAFTIRGQSAPGMKVRIEDGASVVESFADQNGAFAVGVFVPPLQSRTFAVKSVSFAGTASPASVVNVAWSGPAPASQYPIVLVHGAGGFDDILGYEYWFGIGDRLRTLGFEVHVASLTPIARPEERAQQLKQQIQGWTSGKVNLIGHSQGTLDSRYMISKLGMGAKVASFTSIAGPHRGSRIADVALNLIPGPMQQAIDFLLRQLGMDWGSVESLSEQYMLNVFNPSVPDDPSVYYQSYTGIADPFGDDTGTALSPFLVPSYAVLKIADGAAQDGCVTVPSAKWGNFRGTMAADHLTEVGQIAGLIHGFDHRKFYEDVALDLASRGY